MVNRRETRNGFPEKVGYSRTPVINTNMLHRLYEHTSIRIFRFGLICLIGQFRYNCRKCYVES